MVRSKEMLLLAILRRLAKIQIAELSTHLRS